MKQKNNFIINKNEINFAQTLSCGQIFSYMQTNTGFIVYSADKKAVITEKDTHYIIDTKDIEYFKNFFDLTTNYEDIKSKLNTYEVLKPAILFGSGIRILKQDLLETIISFVVSANNNIKRITNTLFLLRQKFGTKIEDYYAFPTLNQLSKITEQEFIALGTGYRAKQLVKLITQLNNQDFKSWSELPTETILNNLINLSGIGPKVADCVLLFGFGKTNSFPVDTWIEKVFHKLFGEQKSRVEMRKILIDKFQNLSGYAQQYLFFYARENKLS